MSTYYELRSGPAPWGDYGYELWNGFTEESEERDQPAILVSRTGPFVAPISVSFGRILVTEDIRRKLVAEGFGSFIRARWVQEGRPHCVGAWGTNAQEPAFYPQTREPEDYLLEGAHREQLAATMPRLWVWTAPNKPLPTGPRFGEACRTRRPVAYSGKGEMCGTPGGSP